MAADLLGLAVDVRSYFDEAVASLGDGHLRAAIVFSWAGFFHILAEDLYERHQTELRAATPSWTYGSLEELKEKYPEHQILEKAKQVGQVKKTELKIYQGQLATRNQYAHPTLLRPTLNEAIGFVDLMVSQSKRYL